MLERRQRPGIERAGRRRVDQVLFLRGGGAGQRKNSSGDEAGGGVHQRLFLLMTVAPLVRVLSGAEVARLRR